MPVPQDQQEVGQPQRRPAVGGLDRAPPSPAQPRDELVRRHLEQLGDGYQRDQAIPHRDRPRQLLPLVVSVVVLADLLVLHPGVPPFRPGRMGVYVGLVDLDEAAWFFRSDPARLHARLISRNAPLVHAPDGSTLVALDNVLTALGGSDPGPPEAGSVSSGA